MSEELKPVGFIYRCGETIHFHRMQLDHFYSLDHGDTYVKGEPVYCRSLPAVPAEQTAQEDREADQAEFHKLWGVCTFNGCHEYNAAKSFWIAALEYARKK